MSKKVLEFDYVDAKGKESHRVVYTINAPTDKYFGVDLTEFDEEERIYYIQALEDIYTVQLEEIKQLGLNNNYRFFKEEGVSGIHKR